MNSTASASRAVDLVHRMLTDTLDPGDRQVAGSVQALIVSNLSSSSHSTSLVQYLGNPQSTALRQELVKAVAEKVQSDEPFRTSLEKLLTPSRHTTMTAGRDMRASGRGIISAGDVSHSNNSTVDNSTSSNTKKTHFGGILVAAVAVVALFLIGRAVIVNLASDEGRKLDGSSTCRDFLAASPDQQIDGLKRVYLANNRPDLAGDPFILQNGQYSCGNSPSITLDAMARRFAK